MSIKNIVCANRGFTKQLSLDDFGDKELFNSWKISCKNLSIAVYEYYIVLHKGNDVTNAKNHAFECLRKVDSFFTDKSKGEKISRTSSDIDDLIPYIVNFATCTSNAHFINSFELSEKRDTMSVEEYKKERTNLNANAKAFDKFKDIKMRSQIACRKGIEDFTADRINKRNAMTIEEIENEKLYRATYRKARKSGKSKNEARILAKNVLCKTVTVDVTENANK